MKKILSFLLVITAFLFVGGHFVDIDAFSGNKTVTITGIFDPAATGVTFSDSVVYPYGSKVSMDLSGTPAGQTFAFWVVNGVVEPDLAINNQFTITNDMNLQVVFTPADKVVAVFIDVNGELLGYRYATSGSEVDITGIPVPSRPGYIANTSSDHRFENILNESTVFDLVENSVFVQRYIRDSYDDYEITVTNGSGTDFYLFNSIATVVANAAPEGQKFSHWEENGIKVSAHESYVFSVLYDRNLTAVFVPTATVLEDEVIVTISNDLELRPGYHSYVGQIEIPAGYSVIEYGFFMGNEAIILDQTNNSNVVQATNIHPITKEFVSSMSIGSHMSVRAYVVVSDGITQTIVTSDRNHRYIEDEAYRIGFEDLTGTNPLAYAATSLTSGNIEWDTYQAYIVSNDANDKKTGTYAVRLRSEQDVDIKAYIQTKNPISNVESISVDYAWYGTHTEGRLYISISNDKINWIDILVGQLPSATLQNVEVNINYADPTIKNAGILAGDPIYIQFRNENTPSTSARSINLDNISIKTLYKGSVVDVIYNELNGNTIESLVKYNAQATSYTPVKTGYSFLGWYDTPEFSGSTYNFSNQITDTLNLYAKWNINQYTITFESNGGTSVTVITEDYNTELSAPTDPTKVGYTFAGWYGDVGLTTPYTFTTMPAQNLTLYAKWNINQYTISFESNGGSTVTAITQNFNTVVAAPSDPIRENYVFAGWYSDTGLTTPYVFTTMPAENITLYADWNEVTGNTFEIIFNSNGGSSVTSQIINENEKALEPTDPTREGYEFGGWYTDNTSFNNLYDFDSLMTADITVYAKWLELFTVTFNSNGGSSVDSQNVADGENAVRPADPTYSGKIFVNWYSDVELTSVFNFSTAITIDTTIYAKWVNAASDLFISEYIEGSSSNKAIEIFNGTGAAVNLSIYSIKVYSNGALTATATSLGNVVLNHGDVYVIYNSSANSAIKAVGDLSNNTITGYNGNDVVELLKNGQSIDIIGTIGSSANFALDVTLVRKSNVTSGVTTYDSTQWEVFGVDTTTYLGSHVFNPN